MNISGIERKIEENFKNEKVNVLRMKNNEIAENSGITLIALVVSIIVLLILAGVSIAMLTGENGIINRAKDSKEQTEIAGEKEILRLAINESVLQNDQHKFTKETLKEVLDNKDNYSELEKTQLTDSGVETIFADSQRAYKIDSDGNITSIDKLSRTSKVLATIIKKDGTKIEIYEDSTNEEIKEIAQQVYGEAVDYHPATDTTGTYRIFYIEDQDNTFGDGIGTIYLKRDFSDDKRIQPIALSDPSIYTTDGQKANKDHDSLSTMWKMNKNWTEKRMMSYYELEWNEKEAIYLCDKTQWMEYVNDQKANYAIGGPSADMYCKSYNSVSHITGSSDTTFQQVKLGIETSVTKYDTWGNGKFTTYAGYIYTINGIPAFQSDKFKEYGTVGFNTFNNNEHYNSEGKNNFWTGLGTLDYENYNSMYCGEKGSTYARAAWWLASPSPIDDHFGMCYINSYQACMSSNKFATTKLGVCPLVSLKQGITLTIE